MSPRTRRSWSPAIPTWCATPAGSFFPVRARCATVCARWRPRPARRGHRGGARQTFPRHLHRTSDAFEHSEEGDTAGAGPAAGTGAAISARARWWMSVATSSRFPIWAGTKCTRRGRIRCGTAYPTRPGSTSCTVISSSPPHAALSAGYSTYGLPFTCAAARGNIFAVQFHPEKSQAAGLRLLANFATWQPAGMPRGATEPRSRRHDLPA